MEAKDKTINNLENSKYMLLTEAIRIYKTKECAMANSQTWWLQRAAKFSQIKLDPKGKSIKVYKGKQLYVSKQEFYDAISELDQKQKEAKNIQEEAQKEEYRLGKHITSWGGYQSNGKFVFIWSDYQIMRKKSDGYWKCLKCKQIAQTKQERCTCSSCENWNGCSQPYKTTQIKCKKCDFLNSQSEKKEQI